ncbi:hypothetical protein, partial [Thiobacillus sp.]|uniref:hypothetical protein n=1 Tax=Thiobacillus sp. TaxID=924 RepID=UPI0025DD3CCB
ASRRKPMICSSVKRFFMSNSLNDGIGLQSYVLLKPGGRRQDPMMDISLNQKQKRHGGRSAVSSTTQPAEWTWEGQLEPAQIRQA